MKKRFFDIISYTLHRDNMQKTYHQQKQTLKTYL